MKKILLLIAFVASIYAPSVADGATTLDVDSTQCAANNYVYLFYPPSTPNLGDIVEVRFTVSSSVYASTTLSYRASTTSGESDTLSVLLPNGINCSNTATLIELFDNGGLVYQSSSATPLPVTLVSQTVSVLEDAIVQLNWVTASEQNNDRFTILSSVDGFTWDSISSVIGAGFSSQLLKYQWLGPVPSGTNYLRLRQTDHDGTLEDFDIMRVDLTDFTEKVWIPNPVSDQLTVNFDSEVIDYRIEIFDLSGHMRTQVDVSQATVATFDLSVPPGIYLMTCKDSRGYQVAVKRFVVK